MKTVLVLTVALLFTACSDEKSVVAQEEISKSIEKISKVVKEESVNIGKSVEKVTQKVSEEVAHKTIVKEPTKIVQKKVIIDAKALFTKCSSCHGVNADKKALNKSQSIKGWSVTKLTDAINGYKNGTYGGSMKAIMKPQVNKLSDDEVNALSEYISKL